MTRVIKNLICRWHAWAFCVLPPLFPFLKKPVDFRHFPVAFAQGLGHIAPVGATLTQGSAIYPEPLDF